MKSSIILSIIAFFYGTYERDYHYGARLALKTFFYCMIIEVITIIVCLIIYFVYYAFAF